MEKILNIDGRQVKFKSTGAFFIKYKAQFGRDAIKDIIKLKDSINLDTKEFKDIEAFDLEVFYNIVWTLAKCANPDLTNPEEWLDSFSEFPLMEIIPEVMELITCNLKSNAGIKKKQNMQMKMQKK